jgi:Kef-type K+ transport system membrane component KefB
MVNLSSRSRRLFKTLGETDPPFYAIFFVIAGADLNLDLVGSMGVLGIAYLVMRALGKFVGARIGARRLKMEPQVQSFLGFGLMAQAGLAVGLTITVGSQFPEYYPVISTVILSSVVVYEMFGPISTKFAIVQSGEARLGGDATQSIWA